MCEENENYSLFCIGYIPEDFDGEMLDGCDGQCEEGGFKLVEEEEKMIHYITDEEIDGTELIISYEEESNPMVRFRKYSQFLLETCFKGLNDLNFGLSADDITIINFFRMEELCELEDYVDDVANLFTHISESCIHIDGNEEYKGKLYVYKYDNIDDEIENEEIYIYNKDFQKNKNKAL